MCVGGVCVMCLCGVCGVFVCVCVCVRIPLRVHACVIYIEGGFYCLLERERETVCVGAMLGTSDVEIVLEIKLKN